jgi:hypothetical protein
MKNRSCALKLTSTLKKRCISLVIALFAVVLLRDYINFSETQNAWGPFSGRSISKYSSYFELQETTSAQFAFCIAPRKLKTLKPFLRRDTYGF